MKGAYQLIGLVVLALIGAIVLVSIAPPTPSPSPVVSPSASPLPTTIATPTPAILPPSDLKTFESWKGVSLFLSSVAPTGYGRFGYELVMTTGIAPLAARAAEAPAPSASDYSTTNVQVEGVDEADILKNDGKYLYTISNGRLVILDAFPATNARMVSVLNDSYFSGMFVNADKLVAFGEENYDWKPLVGPLEKEFKSLERQVGEQIVDAARSLIVPGYYPYHESDPYPESAFIKIYDISDRSAPRLLKKINVKGNYVTSRMIGSKVYAIFSEYAQPTLPMPIYAVNDKLPTISPTEVNYFDYPFESYQFTTLLGLDLNDLGKEESRKIVLMGAGQNIYVSKENAFITYSRYNTYYPIWEAYESILKPLPKEVKEKIEAIEASDASTWRKDNLKIAEAQKYIESLNETQRTDLYSEIYKREQEIREKQVRQSETTVIHKFALSDNITYAGKGEVPGHVLNQFSMDEHEGYFRIATTVGEVSRGIIIPSKKPTSIPSKNNVYVLNPSLQIVGKLEDLAPGEKIYSARFMGNRAYVVTFKKVDPLFVIGLEDPMKPTLLGKLKIPGYSDYLHPYDETHLIGLGKDAVPAEEGDFAWYQGVKLSLFDVSDVANPKELAVFGIGDRGTESYALYDHKAFLFNKKRNLLVVPIQLAEINKEKYPEGVIPQTYGEYVFQGAYVFKATLEGFELKGKISHADPERLAKSGEYYFGGGSDVKRSAYMDDVLYTVSDRLVKANDLNTLEEKTSILLPKSEESKIYGG